MTLSICVDTDLHRTRGVNVVMGNKLFPLVYTFPFISTVLGANSGFLINDHEGSGQF